MSQYFRVHPENPQIRLLRQAADIIQAGGVIAYPTDSAYALGCSIGEKNALERIRRLRNLDKEHYFTLICRDIAEVAQYTKLNDNSIFRFIKSHTPGPYTFILPAGREVPKRILHPKRKLIGVRIPNHIVVQELIGQLGEPLMSTTLQLPGDEYPMVDPENIADRIGKQLDLIIDSGACHLEVTTVVDLSEGEPDILRQGRGDL